MFVPSEFPLVLKPVEQTKDVPLLEGTIIQSAREAEDHCCPSCSFILLSWTLLGFILDFAFRIKDSHLLESPPVY